MLKTTSEKTKKDITFDIAKLTPMLKQYFQIKNQHPGCILFFRVGDFYETYDQDAQITSKELDIILTSREAGANQRIYMAGVPYHAVDSHIRNLIFKGHKVAICDQVEDPKYAKGLVKRAVTKIITSGTITDPEMLETSKNNYLLSLSKVNDSFGLGVADVSTGDLMSTEFYWGQKGDLLEEIKKLQPSEIIIDSDISKEKDSTILKQLTDSKFKWSTLEYLPEIDKHIQIPKSIVESSETKITESIKKAVLLILKYIKETQRIEQVSLHNLKIYSPINYLVLDNCTSRNLELTQTLLGEKKEGTLLSVIGKTSTSIGARLLRNFLERPLKNVSEINQRLEAVAELAANYNLIEKTRDLLNQIYDLERILVKIEYGSCNARDLIALRDSLKILPALKENLKTCKSQLFVNLIDKIDTLEDIFDLIFKSIYENPPITLKEGNLIKSGFNLELDELRNTKTKAKDKIAQLQNEERQRTGIKSLKIGFNNVFGYYIEVTKPNLSLVPSDYTRKQTISTGERYINEKLKEYESLILGAHEKLKNLEYEIFSQIRNQIAQNSPRIKDTAKILAYIDVLVNFAYISIHNNYIKPQVNDKTTISIKAGRHPVIEKKLSVSFTPNDIFLDNSTDRLLIITGPNMAGKSTYLRQTALIVILAQMGCFVPAESAVIGIVDRIFTRVGATDDLHLGQSTFMVEMIETANIINQATNKSLILLDEIGRGTNTDEGLSIAWSVAEFLHNKIGAKTLFATHFHQLTQLTKNLQAAKNYKTLVKETGSEVIFLHKIAPGEADHSFALYVAHLAGIPKNVLNRAQDIFENLDQIQEETKESEKRKQKIQGQLSFIEETTSPITEELKNLDLENFTPLEALNKLWEWKKEVNRGQISTG